MKQKFAARQAELEAFGEVCQRATVPQLREMLAEQNRCVGTIHRLQARTAAAELQRRGERLDAPE